MSTAGIDILKVISVSQTNRRPVAGNTAVGEMPKYKGAAPGLAAPFSVPEDMVSNLLVFFLPLPVRSCILCTGL